jgi:Kef-type K+ transport system membrane component KefB
MLPSRPGFRNAFFYAAVFLIFGAAIVLTLHAGKALEGHEHPLPRSVVIASAVAMTKFPAIPDPFTLLVVQLVVIILAARVFGALFARLGQPAVVGEIAAGIALGPSLLGALAPGLSSVLFSAASIGTLRMLSQIGVLLFMFVVGMELDVKQLRGRADAAVVVSHASILFPYFLGVLVSLLIYVDFAPPGVPFLSFALFMGIAMSITAFPVLARILAERGMSKTFLGATALTCAAVDDVTAWSLLALVVAIVGAQGLGGFFLTIGLAIAFIAVMLFGIRPALERTAPGRFEGTPSKGLLAGVLVFVLLSSLATELIGIHALFGAFLAGVVMPSSQRFREQMTHRLENVSSVLLLPLFFAFTGLRTQIGLLNDRAGWLAFGGIIAVAMLGKLGGTLLSARFTGMSWLDSFSLGALMNTRGLMELIALNVGYDLGILSPRIFTIMVLMALVTTFATGPLLALSDLLRARQRLRDEGEAPPAPRASSASPL